MFSFPLSLLLIPFGLTLIGVAMMIFLNVWHLLHYGATTLTSFVVTFLFLAGLATIGFFTVQELQYVDWSTPVEIGLPTANLPEWKPGALNAPQP